MIRDVDSKSRWLGWNISIELKNKYICSRCCPTNSFYAFKGLETNGIPCLYSSNNNDTFKNHIYISRIKEHKEIQELERKLKREKNTFNIPVSQLLVKCRALKRVAEKLSSGNNSDVRLKKAITRRVCNFVLTFISMKFFSYDRRNSYSMNEQRFCLKLHCTLPSLYNKMHDILKLKRLNRETQS